MKAGDKVTCRENTFINNWFTIGNEYVIDEINYNNDSIFIIDNQNERNTFSFKTISGKYFPAFFYTNQEIRKQKLDKIKYNANR